MPSQPRPTRAEDVVTDRELRDCRTDGFDFPRHLVAENPVLRPQEAGHEAPEKRLRRSTVAVRPVDGGGVDPDEDLVLRRDGLFDVGEVEYVGRAIPLVHNRSHALTSHVLWNRWIGPPWSHAWPAR